MAFDRRKTVLFSAAIALRLLLFIAFPSLPDLLTGRVEISTPVTSFKRLQEGLFLYTHNVSPYDGGVYHQAPLLLSLFSLLPEHSAHPLATAILYIVVDILSAHAVMQIAETGESGSSRLFTSPRKDLKWDSIDIGAAYLFNPFTIATCIARPTSVFTNCAILYATAKAARGNTLTSVFALALASYLSLYPVLLFPPLLLLCYDRLLRNNKSTEKLGSVWRFASTVTVKYVAAIGSLLFISYTITDASWEFLASTYGVQLLLPDLTPNVGLWWYFFIEMFDSFREFFLGVFWLHLASYVGGLTVRLRTQPLFVVTTLLGIFAIFKPYPSISDTSLYLALLPLYRHVFPLMRYTFFAVATLLYATLLGPAFYHLWIYAGSGNANFFYAITLVWSLGLSVIVGDSLFAVLRDEWEVERPEMKGKEVKRI
ncbi:putative GPI transamidase component PIG-U [Xylona heveae TC161]|uniref:Putative GPI transamidase component PIG-U n=1 Tax=Xylona heveae (strain CBS 132557 / TC161) TaxID=1328760 RepID=A0A165JHB1_XYLHT|nr:putative GPI transamidase component PIG-U [Xylona heveae TC161]KZF26240.1 putative GPI transamidase component PIG-U [Xylona heveae TC161]